MNKSEDIDKKVGSNSKPKRGASIEYDDVFVEIDKSEFETAYADTAGRSLDNSFEEVSEYDSEYDVEVIEVVDSNTSSTLNSNIVSEISSVVESIRSVDIDRDECNSEFISDTDDEITEIDDRYSDDIQAVKDGKLTSDNISKRNKKSFLSESMRTEDSLSKVILALFVVFGVLIMLYIVKVLL